MCRTGIFIALGISVSGCPLPSDAEAAGLTAVDGGYVYKEGDAGDVFYPDLSPDAGFGPDRLPAPPTKDQLCALYVGDWGDNNSYPKRVGTWIGDVERLFGKPPRNGKSSTEKDAMLSYLWDGANGTESGISLSFEHIDFQYAPTADMPYDHGEFDRSFWLNGIQLRDGDYLHCWEWLPGEPGMTQLPFKSALPALSNKCLVGSGDPRDCYSH